MSEEYDLTNRTLDEIATALKSTNQLLQFKLLKEIQKTNEELKELKHEVSRLKNASQEEVDLNINTNDPAYLTIKLLLQDILWAVQK